MKKKVGTPVYIICNSQICFGKVGYVGDGSFIVEDYKICSEKYQEYYFDEYNKIWFTSLIKAKKYMRQRGYKYFLQISFKNSDVKYIDCFIDINEYKYEKKMLGDDYII